MKVDLFRAHIRRLTQLNIPIQSIHLSDIFESNQYYELRNIQITALQTDVFSNLSFKNVYLLDLIYNLLSNIDCNVFFNFTVVFQQSKILEKIFKTYFLI